ncbi:MAG: hypothetical protein IKS30_04150 [Treponema sp.]|nr:hypothetical protein [Treponema sp.]
MKIQKTGTAVAIIAISFFSFSCGFVDDLKNLQKPETVKIKSEGAKYSVPLGDVTMDMDKYLNVSELASKMSNDGLEIYDYNHNGSDSVQEFLINYPISQIPLDFGTYLDGLDIPTLISRNISQEITVPGTFAFNQSISLPDFNLVFVNSFNANPHNESVLMQTPGPGVILRTADDTWTGFEITVDFTEPDFDTMTFASGGLVIYCDPVADNLGDDFEMNLIPVLYNSDKSKIIAQATESTRLAPGGTIFFDLSGATIEPSMVLRFNGSIQYGNGGNGGYAISVGMNPVSQISKVTGLTMNTDKIEEYDPGAGSIPFNTTVDMSAVSSFLVSATITDGAITYKAAVPSNWNGIVCESDIAMTGGITANASEFMNSVPEEGDSSNYILNKSLPLTLKKITPEDLTLSGTVRLSFVNATFVFDSSSPTSLDIVGGAKINKLNIVYLKPEKLLDMTTFGQEFNIEFGSSVTEYVDTIEFNKLAITATTTTDLALNSAQGDLIMEAHFTSDAFKITTPIEDDYAISAPNDNLSLSTGEDWTGIVEPASTPKLDIDLGVTVRSSITEGGHAGHICLSELQLDKTYNITSEVIFEYDWVKVVLNTDNTAVDGSFDASFNLKDTINGYFKEDENNIANKIQFNGIEGYLFVTRPVFEATEEVPTDPLADLLSFNGKVNAVYSQTDENDVTTNQTVYLIGSATQDAELRLAESELDLSTLADENGTISDAGDIIFPDLGAENVNDDDFIYSARLSADALSKMFNAEAETCSMNYNLALNSGSGQKLTLTKQQVDTLRTEGSCSLNLTICMRLPLQLEITENIEIEDVLALGGQKIENDVLGRDGPTESDSNFKKYSDLIETITLNYFIKTTTGLNMTANLTDDASGINKSIVFGGSEKAEQAFAFSSTELDRILDSYPFTPKVGLNIKQGTVRIPRSSYLRFMGYVTVETGGEITVYGD